MSLVTQLDIKEFRGIKNCKKPLKFSKLNVLVGRNNSGKSAVLQALSLLPDPTIVQPMNLQFGRGNLRISQVGDPNSRPESVIYRYAGTASLNFEFNGEKKYHIDLESRGNLACFIENRKIEFSEVCEYLGIKENEAQNWAVLVPNNTEFLRSVESKLSSEWAQVEKSESHIKVVREIVNPTVDEKFTEVLRRDHGLCVRKEVEGKGFYINVQDLGDGIKKALNILLFLELCNPKLVLWDDFEVLAHPSLVKRLLLWLSKKEWQVVLATHSIDVLYELVEINPKDVMVMQLRKTGDDVLTYNTLTVEEVEDFLDAGHDPRLLVDLVE